MTVHQQKYHKHLDDAWLMVVAQRVPVTISEVFLLLTAEGQCKDTLVTRRKFEHTLRHLHRKGCLIREKILNVYHYAYDDACTLRPVTGLRFTKALEIGVWTRQL